MYATTGFTREQIEELVVAVSQACVEGVEVGGKRISWPACLGLWNSVVVALTYLRRNRIQAELGESYGVSQPSISRAVTGLTPVLGHVLQSFIPTADDVALDESVLLDGTLCPVWSWKKHPELYSGKHKTTGWNVQVVTDLDGTVMWISDPAPGSWHDKKALEATLFMEGIDTSMVVADKGYQGTDAITPTKKPAGGEITDEQKANNKIINSVRSAVERGIAHLKNWNILKTDYRRPYDTFPVTLKTVIGLFFFQNA
jgi:hypothetical protein